MAFRAYRPLVLEGPEPADPPRPRSEAGYQDIGGGLVLDLQNPEHVQYLRNGAASSLGSMEGAMRVAVAYRCTHIIAGACGNLPIDLYLRVSEQERQVARNHPLRAILQRPNGWQTSSEFRKMLTAHAVLKGNGYALKVTGRGGRILALWPIQNPDRMEPIQNDDMSLSYNYTRKDGSRIELSQADVLHLRGLTLDGIKGIGVVTYSRRALGLSLSAEEASVRLFDHGVVAGLVFSKPGTLSDEAYDRLKQQLYDQNAGAENARKALILEDDLKVDGSLMSAEDLQFLESRKFQRGDVGMFFGVPPHMYGDVDRTTSWGSGIDSQGQGFVTYTADDWFVMWEQCLQRDCLNPQTESEYYVRLARQALTRADTKTRWEAYTRALQWTVMCPDEIRALEDMNPRPDGLGGVFLQPPNTAGTPAGGDPGAPGPDNPPPPEAPPK